MSVITLLTDFGTKDAYVAIMRGVILGINPAATIVDLCHDISPQDVEEAAFVLSSAYPYFPGDAIHLIVVDPGVGSERRAIAACTPRGTFIAPDNGVLSYVFARESVSQIVHLTNPRYWLSPVSDTFHGRDIFAPAAAHLSLGLALADLGPTISDPVRFDIAEPQIQEDGTIVGQVLYIDGFGNLITNIPGERLPARRALRVRIAGQNVAGPLRAYAEVRDGELLALVDSSGYVEIAVRNGSAAATLRVGRGAAVAVTPVRNGT
jgi:S-adenosylmethionine hydrolase